MLGLPVRGELSSKLGAALGLLLGFVIGERLGVELGVAARDSFFQGRILLHDFLRNWRRSSVKVVSVLKWLELLEDSSNLGKLLIGIFELDAILLQTLHQEIHQKGRLATLEVGENILIVCLEFSPDL